MHRGALAEDRPNVDALIAANAGLERDALVRGVIQP